MQNRYVIKKLDADQNKITVEYDIEGEWEKYFSSQRNSYVEYGFSESDPGNVNEVPYGIAVIPFLSNILPIVWLTNAIVELKELDKTFYENIENIKNGYRSMYPDLKFSGKINVNNIVDYSMTEKEANKTACLFSGGVDAFTTLYRHLTEKPYLLTVWGADVPVENWGGWQVVWNHTEQVSKEFGLSAVWIKTDFRKVINWTTLTRGLLHNKYEWWHDFQHGIGIIGHCAPLSYVMGIRVVYIASSYPASMKGQYTCASDPTIDNYMKYARCITIHDGYELNRQEKVRYLLQQTQKLNKKIHLHVCWETTSGENCCHCEKCYRTILEIVSEGGNPNEYGFKWDSAAIVEARKMFTYKITSTKFNIDQYYPPIQERLKVNKDCIPDYDLYRWLVDYDFSNFNRHVSKYIYNNRVVRKLRTIIAKR